MEIVWNKQSGSKSCILFFNGWGMDENAVAHLSLPYEVDLCIVQEYSSVEPLPQELKTYKEIFVVAWSMGVLVAEYLLTREKLPIRWAIAINGTPYPVNEQYGITPKNYIATMRYWDEVNRELFEQRMFVGKEKREQNRHLLSKYSVTQQKEGLKTLYNLTKEEEKINHIIWKFALIGIYDQIIAPKNQKIYWKGTGAFLISVPMPHFPFLRLNHWSTIIYG